MIGTIVSHYKILEKLGEGGMGVVYKAQDLKLNRTVALKFLPGELRTSQEEVKRFHQEASALSALNHPHIATIYDIDEAEGKRFIALEYLPGGTVKSKLKDLHSSGRELPLAQVVEYGVQIAEALSHAHKRNIVHRDVKTDNLLLTEDSKVKITDFGLAKLRGDIEITKTGSTVGTPAYMSPEQIRGEEIDQRSDIFSFGIVLYELTTGRLAFRGEHEAALTYSIVNDDPISIGTLRPSVPAEWERLILKCLEKNKDQRYASCDQIVADLHSVQQLISGYVPTQKPPQGSKGRVLWGAIAAIVTLALGAILYVSVFNPPSKITATTPSIAVLYIENMTEDPKFDSFSAGMTDEIINALSNVPGLQVLSRSDVVQFRGKQADVREIGEKLAVSYILEGSVRVEGKRLRVTCQAIQTLDRFHFWSQGYTRELTSAFDVQSDIAQQVALALKTKFAQKDAEQKLGLPANSLLKQ